MKNTIQTYLFKPRIDKNIMEKAKNCKHLHKQEFVDSTFTGLGIMCLDCSKLITWIIKPTKEEKIIFWLDLNGK